MYPKFVHTGNVKRFMGAIDACAARGAPEASWVLVTGDAGHGKTQTGLRWAHEQDAVHVRIKTGATVSWLLRDIVTELGEKAPEERSREKLYNQAFQALARRPRPIVLDEVEHAFEHGAACLEAVRDLSDFLEVTVVLIGREWVPAKLKRQRQLWSRISAAAVFVPLTIEDVTLLRTEICEVTATAEVDAEVLRQSQGFVREVMNALAAVERIGKRKRAEVTLEDLQGKVLTQDIHAAIDKKSSSTVAAGNGAAAKADPRRAA